MYGVLAPANDGTMILVDTTQTFDAIGRAWSAGLLNFPGKDSAALRDSGRLVHGLYWRNLEQYPTPDSLARFIESLGSMSSSDRERSLETALNNRLDAINKMGRNVRLAFDSLCIDPHMDDGPSWLDSLIWNKRRAKPLPERHEATLRLALKGLAQLV